MTPFPLGRRLEHDPRSRAFPAPSATVVTRSWTHYGPPLDQGHTSSCTGNAAAQALNSKPLHKPRTPYLTEDDALSIYSLATRLDQWAGNEYPPTDDGSSGLAAAKACVDLGRITRYEHGFGLQHTLEALMRGPVMLGTNWYNDMFNPGPQGFITPTGGYSGGHEYLLTGVTVAHQYITCLNSWGTDWGIRGRFRMTYESLDRLLQAEGDATLLIRD